MIGAEVCRLVGDAAQTACEVLTVGRHALDRVAEELLEQEMRTSADLEKLAGADSGAR